jgi:glycosyltransferase involved in cell wall biosynthesis
MNPMTSPSGNCTGFDWLRGGTLSVIIPVRDEAPALRELHRQLQGLRQSLPCSVELVFVDDGSRDGGADILEDIARLDHGVKVLRFLTSRGKSAAYSAGFSAGRGEWLATLDSDLQDDPAELVSMLAELAKGFDLVVGWKQGRFNNEPGKALPSRVFNLFACALFRLRLHDINCGIRVMRREVANALNLYGDYYRFLPLIAHGAGLRVGEVPVAHRKRPFGHSKYGPARFWTSLLDVLALRFTLSFREKPLHVFGTIAMVFFAAGGVLELHALIGKLRGESFQEHIAAIVIGAMALGVATQMLLTGLLAVMLARPTRGDANAPIDCTPSAMKSGADSTDPQSHS